MSGQNSAGLNDGVRTYSFTGALNGNIITGTWTTSFQSVLVAPIIPGAGETEGYPPSSGRVTLTKK